MELEKEEELPLSQEPRVNETLMVPTGVGSNQIGEALEADDLGIIEGSGEGHDKIAGQQFQYSTNFTHEEIELVESEREVTRWSFRSVTRIITDISSRNGTTSSQLSSELSNDPTAPTRE